MEKQTQEKTSVTETPSYLAQEILAAENESKDRQASRLAEWLDISESQASMESAKAALDYPGTLQSDYLKTSAPSQSMSDLTKPAELSQTKPDLTAPAGLSQTQPDLTKTAGLSQTQPDLTKTAGASQAQPALAKTAEQPQPLTDLTKTASVQTGVQPEPAKAEKTAKPSPAVAPAVKDKKTAEMQRAAQLIINELKKVIVGKDEILRKVLMVILAGGHILLEDVPGVGKTTLALGLSKVLNLDYRRIQFTPDTMASDIIGFSVYNKETGGLDYKPGAALCNLFLADEINRTSAKTQAALLEVMEEGGMTVDGITHKIPEPFVCIATQNPLGSAGTQKLPDSQLDRFMVRLSMGYPDLQSQVNIVKQRQSRDPLETVRALASAAHIKTMKRGVQLVRMSDEIIEYAASLCEKTRSMESVEQGVSPRAVLALVQMARASALMDGRDYAIPQDVKNVFIDVCAHRLILTARAKIRKETEENVLQQVLKEIKPPAIVERKGK